MKGTLKRSRSGLTLIEVMVATVVVVIGVLGAMMYRYNSAMDARRADVEVGAGRVALLILEGWKAAAGNSTYDPSTDLGLEILNSTNDISISSANNGVHTVQLTGGTVTYYYAELIKPSVEDVDGDGNNDYGLRKLEVAVTYYRRGDKNISLTAKTIRLSDFVRTY